MTAGRCGRLAAGVVLGLIVGCAELGPLDDQMSSVERRLEQVLADGAYACAPRELALARAHLEFARAELNQGDVRRAKQHVVTSELNAGAAERLSPAERCASADATLGPSPLLAAHGDDGDGDGVRDADDRCPDAAEDHDGYLDGDGCPDEDNDGDGLLDAQDRCPDQREDANGLGDADGCPEPDQAGDGVVDSQDQCPNLAGTQVDLGCPRVKYKGAEVTARSIRLLEPVEFEQDTAAIRSVSMPLLDTLAQVLAEHLTITIEVQGHTDSNGGARRNLELSTQRANAVMQALVQRGVTASRLTARGYGETRPMESNRTSQGRAINRRVELVRTEVGP